MKIVWILDVVPVSELLPDSTRSVQLDTASLKNRPDTYSLWSTMDVLLQPTCWNYKHCLE